MKKYFTLTMLLILLLIFSSINLAAEIYTVKTGDTLWKISKKTDSSIEKIISRNNLSNANNIYVGQKLTIEGESNTNKNNFNYTVKTGDLLWKIAQKYNVTVQEIINLNNIKSPYYIYIGQKILIPGEIEKVSETGNNYFYYTVKAGDILWNISQKYGTTVQKLVELNNIRNAYDLYVGRKLIIPLKETQATDNGNDSGSNNNGRYVPYFFYKIKTGDQIWTIADYFGIKTSTLIRFNNIDNINEIQAGEVLIVPLEKSTKLNYLKGASSKINNYYRVLHNETLTDIAAYYNIPEEGIRAINQLTTNEEVYTGQRLLMPVNPALFKKHKIYKVKSGGEYIFDIAFENGISIKSILKANYLKNQNIKFDAGTIILVPLDENSKATWIEYENGEPVNSWF